MSESKANALLLLMFSNFVLNFKDLVNNESSITEGVIVALSFIFLFSAIFLWMYSGNGE